MEPEDHNQAALPDPRSRMEGSGSSGAGTTAKRRPVRRDPEKRRQQNLQAQKKYREKLKKRLDHLETLAAASSAATPPADASLALVPQSRSRNSTGPGHHCSPQSHDTDSFGLFVDFFGPARAPASSEPAVPSDTDLWDPSTSVDPSHLIRHSHTASRSHHWVGLVDCGCVRPHVKISSGTAGDWGGTKLLSVGPSFCTPDPCANTLRVERICILEAIMSNCLQIGITEQMFCGQDAVSPFFRPGGDAAVGGGGSGPPGPEDTVRTVQRIFNTLKPDVRPVREQVTMMHRPVIDVLPFPTFRKNLIRRGGAVDEEELYHDLLNGLVCWGGAGVSRKDRDESTGRVSTGTPWDGRSWEARPWFLQKYWALLGGEDGELARQSEWWRNMRGEEVDLQLGY